MTFKVTKQSQADWFVTDNEKKHAWISKDKDLYVVRFVWPLCDTSARYPFTSFGAAKEFATSSGNNMKLEAHNRLAAARDIEERLARLKNRRTGDGAMSPTSARHEDTAMEDTASEPISTSITCTKQLVSALIKAACTQEREPSEAHQNLYRAARSQIEATLNQLKAGTETGFAAGVLFYAADTGRILFVKRSDTGDAAGTWCCPGGGVEDDETIDQAVRRECEEEIGFDAPYDLIHMHRDVQPNFVYHNHMAVLPTEFEPQLNHEHTEYKWCDDMPEPMHPRLKHAIHTWSSKQGESK